jgi:hypothetical protein
MIVTAVFVFRVHKQDSEAAMYHHQVHNPVDVRPTSVQVKHSFVYQYVLVLFTLLILRYNKLTKML